MPFARIVPAVNTMENGYAVVLLDEVLELVDVIKDAQAPPANLHFSCNEEAVESSRAAPLPPPLLPPLLLLLLVAIGTSTKTY